MSNEQKPKDWDGDYSPKWNWDYICDDIRPDSEKPKDPINHPSHYELGKFESIEVMEEVFGKEAVEHFCVCNAFKYIWRHTRKNGLEDIKKAIWYLNKYVEMGEKS